MMRALILAPLMLLGASAPSVPVHDPAGMTYVEFAELVLYYMPEQYQQKNVIVLIRDHGAMHAYKVLGITVTGDQPYVVTRKMKP